MTTAWRRTRPPRRALALVTATTALMGVVAGGWARAAPGDPPPAEMQHIYGLDAIATGITIVTGVRVQGIGLDFGIARAHTSLSDSASFGRALPVDGGLVAGAKAVGALLGVPPAVIPRYPLLAYATYPAGPPEDEVGVRQDVPFSGAPFGKVFWGKGVAGREGGMSRADAVVARGEGGGTGAAGVRLPESVAGAIDVRSLKRTVTALLTREGLVPPRSATAEDVLIEVSGLAASSALDHVGETGLVARLESRLAGIALFGGLVTIDSLMAKTEFHWDRPGDEPAVSRAVEVGRVEVLGLPAEIARDGIRFASAGIPLELSDAFNRVLEAAGAGIDTAQETTGDGKIGAAALTVVAGGGVRLDLGHNQLSFTSALVPLQMDLPVAHGQAGGDSAADAEGAALALPATAIPAGRTGPVLAQPAPSSPGRRAAPAPEPPRGAEGVARPRPLVESMEGVPTRMLLLSGGLVIAAGLFLITLLAGRFGLLHAGYAAPITPFAARR